ncbi:hypothetical protein [Janthinobacterium sp. PC23-8]|uniref:hypothetical protein n=1 Tax=Janthinobacterium sp. PC23-8 TaxID=2012679 RepID=UPI00113FFF3C|nr:hypothetical protein [Janthinobacterium sp. PC23-8]
MLSPLLLAGYLMGCLFVGLFGIHRRIGFIGFFILSLLLTPPITLLLLVLTRAKPARRSL